MRRLRMVMLLAGLLLLCTIPAAAYTDTGGHWAENQVDRWTNLGIVKGFNDAFRPDDPLTRGEAAVILDRLLGYPTAAENGFSDLAKDAFYTEAILHLQHAGVYNGYPDGTLRPTAWITRQETVVLLSRAFWIPLQEETVSLPYRDQAQVAEYARPAVAAFTQAGYLQGTPEQTFCPTRPITRAEFVTILHRMIDQMAPDEPSIEPNNSLLLIRDGDTVVSDVAADAILIAPGVGDGTVTLDNVTAKTVYALGGGAHSVVIQGNSHIESIHVARQDGTIRILVSGTAEVDVLHVDDGRNGVILTGAFSSVSLASDDAHVALVDARVDVLTVSGANAALTVDRASRVDTLFVAETASGAAVDSKGTIGSVTVENETATILVPDEPDDSDDDSSGSSSGDGDTGDPKPEQTIFGVRITILGKGSIFAEEVPQPDPDPEPEPDPDLDPEWYGYPMTVTIEGGHGFVLAEVQTEAPEPPDTTEYILTIEVEGQGTVLVQGGY